MLLGLLHKLLTIIHNAASVAAVSASASGCIVQAPFIQATSSCLCAQAELVLAKARHVIAAVTAPTSKSSKIATLCPKEQWLLSRCMILDAALSLLISMYVWCNSSNVVTFLPFCAGYMADRFQRDLHPCVNMLIATAPVGIGEYWHKGLTHSHCISDSQCTMLSPIAS